MLRRDFIKRALQTGAILPLASSGLFARPLHRLLLPDAAVPEGRVLVLINLSGGNDGLNTVIPVNDSKYYNARPNIAIAKAQALSITSDLSLHPQMSQIQSLYNDGQCAIVQSVGYPDQDRSHFRSTDIWHTASDADELVTTGWLGRYLEMSHPEYPATLPSSPFAMQIASSATLALQGTGGGMGMAIDNPDRFYNLANGLSVPNDPLPGTLAGPELEYVRSIIAQSNQYSSRIHDAMLNGSTNASYDADTLSSQLKVVARLINGGLETGIYVVSIGGFDTHNGQVPAHAQRLGQLSKAVKNFLDDVAGANNGDRVACMTYSEFGRRVEENGSAGSDHGAAAPQFVFGKKVLGGNIIGGAPNLVDLDSRGDIKFANDFRQIYASVMRDWLGFSSQDTRTALGGEFSRLPLFEEQMVGAAPDESDARLAGIRLESNIPNPVSSTTAISFAIPHAQRVRLYVVGGDGRAIASLVDRTLDAGEHRLQFDASTLSSGSYLYILEAGRYKVSKMMKVVR